MALGRLTDNQYTEPRTVYSGLVAPHLIKDELAMDGPASGFYYTKDLLFFVPFSWFGSTMTKTLEGEFMVEIRDFPFGGGTILFRQRVNFKAQVVAIVDPFFGSIGFATWFPLDQNQGSGEERLIKTEVIGGVEIDPADGWKFLDQTNATPLSEFGTTIFDPIAVVSTNGIFLTGKWVSPRYKVQITQPAFLEKTDTWQVGLLGSASFAFAFRADLGLIDAFIDRHDGMVTSFVYNRIAQLSLGYTPYDRLQRRAIIQGGDDVTVIDDRNGVYHAFVKETEGYNEYQSFDGLRRLEKIRTVWPTGIKMARANVLRDGKTIVTLGLEGFELYARMSSDNYATVFPVTRVEKSGAYTPIQDRKGKLYAVGETGVVATSMNNGRNWKERAKEPTAMELVDEDGRLLT